MKQAAMSPKGTEKLASAKSMIKTTVTSGKTMANAVAGRTTKESRVDAMESAERQQRPVLSAEEQRRANILENMRILQTLAVASTLPKKARFQSLLPPSEKKKPLTSSAAGNTTMGRKRSLNLASAGSKALAASLIERRCSGRIRHKPVLYDDLDFTEDDESDEDGVRKPNGNKARGNINEKTITDKRLYRFRKPFGSKRKHITGELPTAKKRITPVPIVHWWPGAYSICLNGGYEDDIDCGDSIAYTGAGGRNLKGTKTNPKNLRTAPQSCDQHLDGTNHGIFVSMQKKQPIRIMRGYKLDSQYAPKRGYRYDGLYEVSDYRYQRGVSGFMVYRFYLNRLLGQDPPPWSPEYTEVESNRMNAFNDENGEALPNTTQSPVKILQPKTADDSGVISRTLAYVSLENLGSKAVKVERRSSKKLKAPVKTRTLVSVLLENVSDNPLKRRSSDKMSTNGALPSKHGNASNENVPEPPVVAVDQLSESAEYNQNAPKTSNEPRARGRPRKMKLPN